jgi:uncharacterized SAM-dependent methyltransferase
MSSLANISVHASQFPDQVRQDLLDSLRTRQVNHKFHYDSIKQTQKWLELHQAYSPSRTDADCAATYNQGFAAAAATITARRVHLIGLGCGGGQKDVRLLELLWRAGKTVFYTPSDVSTAMVLVARRAALAVVPEEHCSPLVCDLATAHDLASVLERLSVPDSARFITFFGMLPNFEPQVILPRLAELLRPGDTLLLSANLAPGPDYAAGVQKILPLYDNAMTRDWLMTFLSDFGVETADGEIQFCVEDVPISGGLKRVVANFRFKRSRKIILDEHEFGFEPGATIRVFFSYRHTPALVRALTSEHGFQIVDQWITRSEEEGVFLVARASRA